ncbi:MAG: hypothetical protein IKN00_03460 [Bacteroidales bacterium]|nr:hypothetical protein [Bacteroidales bacterium]
MKTSTSPHYYHCATKGFDHCVLFADAREFVAGMNRIALCTAKLQETIPVIVIAFCLMDNHKLTMMWQRSHRESAPIDEPWEYDAWQVYDEEDLKQKIAYIFRNPTVARMGFTPQGYRWSSARLVFSDYGVIPEGARSIGSLSSYEFRNAFESKIALPVEWHLLQDGLIWPGCYTDFKRVERLFGHPRNLLFYLNQNVETEINQQMYGETISLPDQDVAQIAREIAQKRFGIDDMARLDLPDRILLCRLVKKGTRASLKQLARISHLPLGELKKIFV